MEINELKYKLCNILNDTKELQVSDIVVDEIYDTLKIYMSDGSLFEVKCEYYGEWYMMRI